jgi:uncharacterized protein (DUF488 family)
VTVKTVGYEACGLPAFVARLRTEGVETLMDVRQLPNSRRAGFSKTVLAASLAEAGIAYRHFKALGTPKAGRDAAKAGDTAGMQAIYSQTLAQPEAGLALAEIAHAARTATICLMCLEADWTTCHRAMICERLRAEYGVEATHITA